MNKTYQRKTLPKVTIINIVEDYVDEEGDTVGGHVSYLNESCSKGVMPWKMFMEMYEESGCGN